MRRVVAPLRRTLFLCPPLPRNAFSDDPGTCPAIPRKRPLVAPAGEGMEKNGSENTKNY